MFHRNAGRIILNNFFLVAEIPDADGVMHCSAIDLNDYVTGRDGISPCHPTPPSGAQSRRLPGPTQTKNPQANSNGAAANASPGSPTSSTSRRTSASRVRCSARG